jgi:hypothetical protein
MSNVGRYKNTRKLAHWPIEFYNESQCFFMTWYFWEGGDISVSLGIVMINPKIL